MVHVRQVEDRTLTFIVSGKLWRNSLIMQDKETGSLWSHVTGECLEGEYGGVKLEMMPVVQTTWEKWSADHPETRVLEKSEEIKSSSYERYFNDPDRAGMFQTTWLRDRLPGKTLIHGLVIGTHALAVTDQALGTGAEMTGKLGEIEVKILRNADGGVSATRADTGAAVIVRTAYWFAWSTYFPNTGLIE